MMEKKERIYMKMALELAGESYCVNARVGCVLVGGKHGDRIISTGYNGTIRGADNICEDPATGQTHLWVLHAEANSILKAARDGQSTYGATLYTTMLPCPACSKMIAQCGISRVIFKEYYWDRRGEEWLWAFGVEVYRSE